LGDSLVRSRGGRQARGPGDCSKNQRKRNKETSSRETRQLGNTIPGGWQKNKSSLCSFADMRITATGKEGAEGECVKTSSCLSETLHEEGEVGAKSRRREEGRDCKSHYIGLVFGIRKQEHQRFFGEGGTCQHRKTGGKGRGIKQDICPQYRSRRPPTMGLRSKPRLGKDQTLEKPQIELYKPWTIKMTDWCGEQGPGRRGKCPQEGSDASNVPWVVPAQERPASKGCALLKKRNRIPEDGGKKGELT